MPLPKIKASGAADAMKSYDGNASLDTFIRQAIGKEPFLSFSRTNDSPVQWIQLLHALDQQDLPGWPLLSPLKVQMQKCDKCSREFCSTISYRRHMLLHRRNLNLDKDSTTKNRSLLETFWDKLSLEEAMEIMSFNDVSLEGVPGSSIVKALTSFIRKPGFTSLPHSYVKSGSALLDIVQGRPSRFPVSSQELFSILDDASENTFLCAGTAESLQKYVFDGEAGKIGLEMRNLVSCTSFLVEQKLVKACLADKDAEALRYQKLLVEEEEAAQKRQAALLEKKRQKKLRQKEQRAKEQASAVADDSPDDRSPSPPISIPVDVRDSSDLVVPEISHNSTPTPEPIQIVNVEGDIDKYHENGYSDLGSYQNVYPDLGAYQNVYPNVEHKTLHRNDRRHMVNSRRQALKLQRTPNGFHTSPIYQSPKPGSLQKHASSRDSRTAATNGVKVWTPKPKSETDEETYKTRLQIEAPNLPGQHEKHEVLIGSISVTLGNRSIQQQDENLGGILEIPAENGFIEGPVKNEAVQGTANGSTVKLWRPVIRLENGGQLPIQNSSFASQVAGSPCNNDDEVQQSNSNGCENYPDSSAEGGRQGCLSFSRQVAEAFLTKRWKEAIASDHVKLVLFPEARPPECPEVQDDSQEVVLCSKLEQCCILRSAENRLASYGNLGSSAAIQSKISAKPEKGGKFKYIPKQRSAYCDSYVV